MASSGITGVGSWQSDVSGRNTYRADKIPQKAGWKVSNQQTKDSWKVENKPSGKYKIDVQVSNKFKEVPSYTSKGGSRTAAPKGSELDILV